MRREERSIGTLLMTLVTLGLLAIAFSSTWFQYDYSTPRHVAPDGPYEEDGVETHHLRYDAQGWHGDVEPTDPAMAQNAVDAIRLGTLAVAGLLVVVALGEIPYIASLLRRPVSLVVLGAAFAGIAAIAVATWFWLPASLAGLGVDSQYTAALEDDGYTHTTMAMGWYAMALSWCTLFGAGLFKFQAGNADASMIEAHRA